MISCRQYLALDTERYIRSLLEAIDRRDGAERVRKGAVAALRFDDAERDERPNAISKREPNNETNRESDFEARRHNGETPAMRLGFQPTWSAVELAGGF
jgi:hypothetical protein